MYSEEDYFEKSDLDKIQEEFLIKAKECLNKEKKKLALEGEKKLKEGNDLIEKANQIKFEYLNKLNFLEERMKKQLDIEKADWIKTFLDYTIKPGDIVYRVKSQYITIKCPKCLGTKKYVVSIDGEIKEIKCPFCCGGELSIHYYYYKAMKVKEIIYSLSLKESGLVEEIEKPYTYGDDDLPYNGIKKDLRYIYVEGESSSVTSSTTYMTAEEAQKEADSLNNEQKENLLQKFNKEQVDSIYEEFNKICKRE